MKELTYSDNYKIWYEYETVFLQIKDKDQLIVIGEFYGDPQVAIISKSETFCVVGGCGIIIYHLKEPYERYLHDVPSPQWKEWRREDENNTIWVNDIRYIDEDMIEVETEDSEKILISIHEDKED